MDEEIERLVVSVRADTQGFARDVAVMRAELDGPFAAGWKGPGGVGKQPGPRHPDAANSALRICAALRCRSCPRLPQRRSVSGLTQPWQWRASGGGSGGLLSVDSARILSLHWAARPGRATGGPVSPGRAYRVGERGPELFVPTSSWTGRNRRRERAHAQISLTINVSDNGRRSAPDALQRSARQVARAVRQALARAED